MTGQSEIEVKAGEKVRSYSGMGFTLVIPEILYTDDLIRIKFSIRNQHGKASAMVVDRCTIVDKVGKSYQSVPDDIFLTPGFTQKQIIMDIENKGKGPMWRDASVCVVICSQNGRKFEIHYKSDVSRKLTLEYIMWKPMVPDDEQRFIDVFNAFMQPKSADKPDGGTTDTEPINKIPLFTTPTLEEYKSAILREMTFLKQNGGRKYKVTNGRYVSQVGTMYSYHFEMEAELNLFDDAPITVIAGGTTSDGTVLVCEDFQIIIIIDKDLGSRVGSAYISVEPWKLLEVLHKKIANLTSLNKIAIKLLEEGPTIAKKGTYTEIPQGQQKAKEKALNEDITIIWGPPGTGKTYTMSEIAIEFLAQGKSILVVSHSNISVDGVVKQLEKLLMERGEGKLLQDGKILRYGYVREEELAKNPYAVAFNYTLGKNRVLKQQMERLLEERDKLKTNNLAYNERRVQIERELKGIRAKVREMERIYVERAQFVATTISKVNIDQLFDDKKYDVVMFDEVSMAYVPQLLSAAAYAKEHFIAVGDFRQLSPIAQSEAKKVLDMDIFSYLHISAGDNIYSHPWLVMLNEQRRMHPQISAFPNKYVYNHLLKDHESVKENRKDVFNREPLCGSPMNLIDLSGTYCAASKNSDNSRFNILSAVLSFATAITAEDDAEKSIGIITPYAAQTRLIRAMIQDYRKAKPSNIACSTVHQFQGSERNLIVFDAVESFPSTKPGWLMSKNDNGSVTRLINVAVTRAKGKLVTVANSKFWLRKFDKTQHIFYRLVKYLMARENVVDVKDGVLREYIQHLTFGKNIKCYSSFEECQTALKKDLAKARDKISISIPDGQLESKSEKELLALLQEQKINGIRILMKSNDYATLPETWKKYVWGSDEAMFPLLAIDDNVIWYGVPDSRLMFKDKDMGYTTICKIILRITGEHTIEILKSLSDLEYRIVDGQRKPLHEKDEKDIKIDDEDGKGAAGLGKFVEEYAKCPKCKKPMKLTRSRAGKIFLKCSVCGELDYLKPDFTNWYISKNSVKCPIHKCGLCAGVGKYGIYVKCDQGHYLKPDEI